MNWIDPLNPPPRETVAPVLRSCGDKYRQNGEVPEVRDEVPKVPDGTPQGAIVTSKPGDWAWTLLSVVLILAVCTINFWVPMLSKLIGT
jgi:hypothetical protein